MSHMKKAFSKQKTIMFCLANNPMKIVDLLAKINENYYHVTRKTLDKYVRNLMAMGYIKRRRMFVNIPNPPYIYFLTNQAYDLLGIKKVKSAKLKNYKANLREAIIIPKKTKIEEKLKWI